MKLESKLGLSTGILVGARGAGEIDVTGVAAAIGNAIYPATGKRVRDFPIILDKLMNA
jgi:xanthine dehydrogenase YagR molybdenum-binding subunit